MKFIDKLKLDRYTLDIKELTVGQSFELSAIPESRLELGANKLVEMVSGKSGMDMSVHERAAILSHYIASISDDYNFEIGGDTTYADYLLHNTSFPTELPIIQAGGDSWQFSLLTGYMAETAEAVVPLLDFDGAGSRIRWIVVLMALQLSRIDDKPLSVYSPAQLEEFILERCKAFLSYTESDFINLMAGYLEAVDRTDHYFKMAITDQGVAWYATKEGATGTARFCFTHARSLQG